MVAALLIALLAAAPQPADATRLQIDVTMPAEATGTMHYAEEVTIRLPGGPPLSFHDASMGLHPIFNDQIPLGDGRWLVLGWSSTGGTDQTLTAMLIEGQGNRLSVAHTLSFTSSRGDSVLLVRRSASGARIGITAPFHWPRDSTIEDPWALRYDTRTLARSSALRMKPDPISAAGAADHVYPLTSPPPRIPAQGVLWIDVGRGGFSLAPAAATRK